MWYFYPSPKIFIFRRGNIFWWVRFFICFLGSCKHLIIHMFLKCEKYWFFWTMVSKPGFIPTVFQNRLKKFSLIIRWIIIHLEFFQNIFKKKHQEWSYHVVSQFNKLLTVKLIKRPLNHLQKALRCFYIQIITKVSAINHKCE